MARDEMTLPNVVRDLLMFAPSFSLWPVAPVEFARSDPAKSTRLRAITCTHERSQRTFEGGYRPDS